MNLANLPCPPLAPTPPQGLGTWSCWSCNLWERFCKSTRCSRDTFPESYNSEYTLVYEDRHSRWVAAAGSCRQAARASSLVPSLQRLVIYCQTTSVSAAHATHCATYCTPCRPLIRAFSGWIRTLCVQGDLTYKETWGYRGRLLADVFDHRCVELLDLGLKRGC